MRAREQYTMIGPERLGDADLLALVLGTGTARRSAPDIARDLLERFGGLVGILNSPVAALAEVDGVGPARAVRLHAALQAGHRATCAVLPPRMVLGGPADAAQLLQPRLAPLPVEELHGVLLDRRQRVVSVQRLSRGSDANTIVDPREVFRPAIQAGAAMVLLAHNHPSGDPSPSPQDRAVTLRLVDIGRMLGVPLVDHLVIASGGWVSMAAEGLVPSLQASAQTWDHCTG